MTREIIETDQAPAAIGAYSQAVSVPNSGQTIYVSGQIPLDPACKKDCEVVSEEFIEQAERVFLNLAGIASAAGGTMQDYVKLNVYVTDLKNFPILNEVMEKHFDKPYPARAAVQVSALPKQAKIEIDGVLWI
jgi:reactive intermediate/imine deaminase